MVSVVFLPPTLVASSYGMNFEFMPELKWSFGYPGAIIFMILAGWRRTSTSSAVTGCKHQAGGVVPARLITAYNPLRVLRWV